MKWISTTIKKKYMDKILSGEKKIEYKEVNDYWHKRIYNLVHSCPPDGGFPLFTGINFLCGRQCYKYKIESITLNISGPPIDIDGKEIKSYYEIHLGERIC